MRYTVIAPLGDNIDALFVGIREFSTEKIILLVPEEKDASKVKNDLERFKIQTQIIVLKGDIWEEMFKKIGELKEFEKNVLINVSSGDRISSCAAISAAFVHGLKAFSIIDNKAMMLPIMKFSYYKLLTDKKMRILEILNKEKDFCLSLEELAKKIKMSFPLISYHVHGNLKSEGLVELGLVEITEHKGKVAVQLSVLGRILVRGYFK